jgi:hypothetical protein
LIWITWAQHRREALVSGLILMVAATGLLVTGVKMLTDFDRSGIARCFMTGSPASGVFATGSSCETVLGDFPLRWHTATIAAFFSLVALPALLGVFVAAPLFSREFEEGTNLLAWSQSITKIRWAVVKIGLIAVFVVVTSTALTLIVIWWHRPLDQAAYNGQWDAFDIEGMTPIAYAIFALALGTLAGLIIRRTVPAMAVTLFVFVAVRVLVAQARPHFVMPLTGSASDIQPGAWAISQSYYADAQRHQLPLDQVNTVMAGYRGASASGATDYLRQHGIRLLADYQPADRFWTFQLIEAAVFVAIAAALLVVSLWWLQRRL